MTMQKYHQKYRIMKQRKNVEHDFVDLLGNAIFKRKRDNIVIHKKLKE